MSYALLVGKQPDHLHIEVTGIRTPETIVAVAKECVASCKEHGCAKILLDVKAMAGGLNAADAYDILRKPLPAIAHGLGLQMAIVDAEANRERYEFFENVAVNVGLDLRVFTDAAAALRWLRREKKPRGT